MKKKLVVTLLLLVLSAGSVTAALLSFGRVTDKLEAARASEPVHIEETEEEEENPTPSPVPEEEAEDVEDKSGEPEEVAEAEEITEAPTPEETTETPAAEEQAETPTEAPTGTEAPTPEPVDPSKPVLTLTSDTIEIAAGSSFSVVSAVADVTDDKDDRNTLFRYIHVTGDYDLRTPGQYTLEYTVTDKDGNVSLPQMLNLIVK